MQIKLIDFGYTWPPMRAHYNDAGADVYAQYDQVVMPGETVKMSLGYGLELPDGYVGFVFPRSSLAAKGIICELPPIDSGYKGEIHAVITNHSDGVYKINKGDRVGQLVILPVIIPTFTNQLSEERADSAFGSTGR